MSEQVVLSLLQTHKAWCEYILVNACFIASERSGMECACAVYKIYALRRHYGMQRP